MEKLKLSLANTPDSVSSFCSKCNSEWNTVHLREGVCHDCIEKEKWKKINEQMRRDYFVRVLGERWYQKSVDDFIPTEGNRTALEAIRSFDPQADNLFLWGKAGTGKSYLSAMAVRKYLEENGKSEMITQTELFRSLRKLEALDENERMKELIQTPLLVIDDMGVSRDTEYANAVMWEILERRYQNMINGLIVTSNLSLDDLAKKSGNDRITDRIAGMCQIIEVKEPESWRLKKAKNG